MTIKALILAGGYGTRLCPLTLHRPSSLIEFGNKPILFRQIDALIDAGVTHIILTVCYKSDLIEEKVKTFIKNRHVEVTFCKEDKKLGPGGYIITLVAAFASAKQYLKGSEPFFLIYGNVVCDYPFKELIKFHRKRGGIGTMMVIDDSTSKKPNEATIGFIIDNDTRTASLGCIYVFECAVFDKITKNEKTIPSILSMLHKDYKLYVFVYDSFWARLTNIFQFLSASHAYLQVLKAKSPSIFGHASLVVQKGLIDPSVTIGKDCVIGENVVIGKDVKIGDSVNLNNCVILSGSTIKSYSYIENSIVGWGCTIVKACVQNYSLLGKRVSVADGVQINKCRVLPYKTVLTSPSSHENMI